MTPVAGWYPDPSGIAALRFWDGQTWTSSTADAPPAPPSAQPPQPQPPQQQPTAVATQAYAASPTYAAPSTYGTSPIYGSTPPYGSAQLWATSGGTVPAQPYRRSRKRLYAVIGAVVALAVAATVVPLALSDGHAGPSTAQFTSVLLANSDVEAIAAGTFTSAPATDNNSNDNSQADCKDTVQAPKGAEQSDAGRTFSGQGQFAEEDLSYTKGSAGLFTELKAQLAACHQLTVDGNRLALSVLTDPKIAGADATLAMQATGSVSGVSLTFDIAVARFGNNVVEVTYGGRSAPEYIASIANQLLQASAAKAKTVF